MTNQITLQYIQQYLLTHSCTCTQSTRTLHVHPNAYEIMLFKSGNVDYFINDTTYHLKPGDLTLVRPNDIHGHFIKDDTPYERLPVHIEESIAMSLSTSKTDLLSCFSGPTPHLFHLNKEQIQQFEYCVDTSIDSINENRYGCDVLLRANLSLILLLVNSAQQSYNVTASDVLPKIIQDAITYINQNFSNDISVQSIADHLNISRSRLCHIFKECMGISLWNYVIAKRIQHAQILLKQGFSITATCYECGFQNYAHFVKVFGKFTGMSPGRYVKSSQTYLKTSPEKEPPKMF